MTRRQALELRREELLTLKEFSFVARISVRSLRRNLRHGRQPGAIRIGGQWRIDLAACHHLSPSRTTNMS